MDDHPWPMPHGRLLVPAHKTELPAPPPTLLSRSRLLRLVAPPGGAEPHATLVCAPAGSGKTTLLADWLRTRPGAPDAAVAWVSLGPEDNDPRLLWQSVLVALERSGAWSDDAPPADLRPPDHRPGPEFTVAFHSAFASVSRAPVVLVLDDVHEVTDPTALAGLDLLLRNPPPALRLVLAARFEPPLALARLRLEGRIRDVDAAALAFSAPEAEALLRGHDVRLSAGDLGRIIAVTEGWAAGLRMAAMSLAGSDRADRVTAFGGDQRAVADYLEHEVLAGLEPRVRRFLLDTSIGEPVSVELARALSGRDDAGAVLDELERTNSLVTRPERDTYRYHPLLRQYLVWELNRDCPDEARRLHGVVARWLADHGDGLDAIRHAGETGDGDLLAGLMATHGLPAVTSRGEGARVREIVARAERLGAAVAARAAVALASAAAALDAGDPVAAARTLGLVTVTPAEWPGPRPGGDPSAPGPALTSLTALTEAVALQRARLDAEPGVANRLLDRSPAEAGHPDVELVLRLERGLTAYWLGRLAPAERELRHALAVARAGQRTWIAMRTLAALADVALARTDLPAAGARAAETMAVAAEHGWAHATPTVHARVVQAWLAFYGVDDATAERLARLPDSAAGKVDDTVLLSARLLLALVRFQPSVDRHEVLLGLQDIWQDFQPGHVQPQLAAVSLICEQRMALAVGETTLALEIAERGAALLGETGEVALMRAVAQQGRGRLQPARQALRPALATDGNVLSPLTRVLAWLWEARLADRAGDGDRAVAAVARAVSVAAPLGVVRPLAHGGQEIADLLSRAAGTLGHDEAFVEQVRALTPPADELAVAALTTRELELLTELPSLRTAEEIASSMQVSVNTVKTHIRGIYRKLGVTNRRDAVLTARRQGLL
jgi:LuxR family maltose regulon positive regulatory protein